MSSSMHVHQNMQKEILREGPKQRLDNTTLTPEAKYPINFKQLGKGFVLSPNHTTKICPFKEKDSDLKDYALCLCNVSKDVAVNMKQKNRIKRSCKGFFCSI